MWLNEWLPTHSLTLTHVDDFLFSTIEDVFRRSRWEVFDLCPALPVLSVQEPQEYVRAEVESEDARAEVESVLGAWSDVLILLLFLSASLALLGAARLEERIRSLWSQPPMAARQHMHTHLHTTYASLINQEERHKYDRQSGRASRIAARDALRDVGRASSPPQHRERGRNNAREHLATKAVIDRHFETIARLFREGKALEEDVVNM